MIFKKITKLRHQINFIKKTIELQPKNSVAILLQTIYRLRKNSYKRLLKRHSTYSTKKYSNRVLFSIYLKKTTITRVCLKKHGTTNTHLKIYKKKNKKKKKKKYRSPKYLNHLRKTYAKQHKTYLATKKLRKLKRLRNIFKQSPQTIIIKSNTQIKNTTIRKTRKNLVKRAYLKKRVFRKKRFRPHRNHLLVILRQRYPLIRSGHIYIKLRRINTFLTMITLRKKGFYTLSTGTLNYNGRKKSSPFARTHLAKKFAQKLLQKQYRFVDIHFVSKKGKFYRFILKGFIIAKLIIRILQTDKLSSHGDMRSRKAKRK